jgi:hypothetical protein
MDFRWQNVTRCRECCLTAGYLEQHPVDPCPLCGSSVKEMTGRWEWTVNRDKKWWEVWKKRKGRWIVKEKS